MNVAQIERVVADIAVLAWDDESAHGAEDGLHKAVLLEISQGTLSGAECAELAAAALKTIDVEFARWCA